ncbi:DUF72 domain-containing protein [Pseudomonas sp. PDNC002]|uniref:DUF72 domain-containing protein n=1 Tax=Pseudomonas sp. PDNC002 TaxID=2811422 RepID=UPI001965D47B|nr:DUF72 domain-containing protein [Pseudomonas sp. PDNC002]QRY77869.1 DUF72 domain-containing protein [Pseudomonas sp. PDNC002]
MKALHIGISGWRYVPWRGDFYPEGLRQKDELRYASRAFDSIELNGSFYALQTPERYRRWAADTPAGFVFSVKAPRYITHIKRLRDAEEGVANFFASGPLELGEKLGPILWQLPPSLKYDADTLEAFLALLPRSAGAALTLAKSAASRTPERWPSAVGRRPLRHAMEVRHASFACAAFAQQLRRHGVALVFADAPRKWPYGEDLTAMDFVYLRLHGDQQLYASGYGDTALERWSQRIGRWQRGLQPADAKLFDTSTRGDRRHREVFCYFDNDIKVRAPYDASRLMALLGLELPDRQEPGQPAGDWT